MKNKIIIREILLLIPIFIIISVLNLIDRFNLVVIKLPLIFLYIYTVRYFFKFDYSIVLKEKDRGNKISGFYSEYSLKSRENYYLAYNYWVNLGIKLNLILLLLSIIIYIFIKKEFKNYIVNIFLLIILLSQVLIWMKSSRYIKSYHMKGRNK